MGNFFGCWSWNEADGALVRSDGAVLQLLGGANDLDHESGYWFRFRIRCAEGETPLLVQQRLIGFHGQYRTLIWRADFTRSPVPSSYRQWAAFAHIAADGLACWPITVFGEIPDFVGVEGGWADGTFRDDRYRIYERVRVQRLLDQGRLPEIESDEPRWRFQPLDPSVSAPTRAELAKSRSARDARAGLAAMIDRGPALVSQDRAILLEEDEHGSLNATYVDEDFVSDRYMISGLYRSQEDRWGVGDYAKVQIGARRLTDFRAAEKDPVTGFLALFWKEPRRHNGREAWAPDPLLLERSGRSFAEALFYVPDGAFSDRRVHAPPLLVSQSKAWLQAGYVQGGMSTSHTLGTDEFVAAFDPAPPSAMFLRPREGVTFDRERALLTGPDGERLVFERLLAPHVDGDSILFRCIRGDLDWPVIVRQSRHRFQELRPWRVDHDACLAMWRSETGRDLPDPDEWDCLRQFLEDALLSWSDCDLTGIAPQQLIATGGFYDGRWRGDELTRTLIRPFHYDETVRDPDVGDWSAYRPQAIWRRTDDLPPDLPERNYSSYSYVYARGGDAEPPIAFAKMAIQGRARLAASTYWIIVHRDEAERHDHADYSDGRERLRFQGVRSNFELGRVWSLDANAPSDGKWNPSKAQQLRPDIATWRKLRDAAESGLRPGEDVTLSGAWIFDRFFAGFATRKTALENQAAVSA